MQSSIKYKIKNCDLYCSTPCWATLGFILGFVATVFFPQTYTHAQTQREKYINLDYSYKKVSIY